MPSTSDITVGGLNAQGATGQINLTWDPPSDPNVGKLPYLQQSVVEVWGASENDRDAADKLGEQTGEVFTDSNLSRGEQRWYWIRCRNASGMFGEWHPVAADMGVTATEANDDFLLAANGHFVRPNGLIEQWGIATSDLSGDLTVTFTKTFPNEMFNFSANSSGSEAHLIQIISFNNFQLFGTVEDTSGLGKTGIDIYWRALGW